MFSLVLCAFAVAPPIPDPLPKGAIARLGEGGPFAQHLLESVAFSPDGSRVAVRASKGLEVWDTRTRTVLASWKDQPVNYAGFPQFTPDGKFLLCNFNGIWCFEVETGKLLYRASNNLGPLAVTNVWIAHAPQNDSILFIREVRTGKELRQIPFKNAGVCRLAARPDPSQQELILLTPRNELISLDIRNGKQRWKQTLERAKVLYGRHLAYDPRGKWIATAGPERLVRLWTPEGKPGRVLAMDQGEIWGLSFDPKGRLAVLFHNRVTIYEVDTGRILHQQPLPGLYQHVALSATGEFWVSGDSRRVQPFQIGQVRQVQPKGHLQAIRDIVPLPTGGWMTLALNNEIIEWDAKAQFCNRLEVEQSKESGLHVVTHLLPGGQGWLRYGKPGVLYEEAHRFDRRLDRVVPSHAPNRAAAAMVRFSPDHSFRIVWCYENFLQGIDTRTGQTRWQRGLPRPEHPFFWNQEIEFSPNGSKFLLRAYNSAAQSNPYSFVVCDVQDGRIVARIPDSEPFNALALFLDDETILITRQWEDRRQLWKWHFPSGRYEMALQEKANTAEGMVRSNEGRWLVLHSRDEQHNAVFELYESRTFCLVQRWVSKQTNTRISWSLDNRIVATGGCEGLIYLWDATGGAEPSSNLNADWQRLDERAGHQAAWRLAKTPGVERFLARKLQPTLAVDERTWARLLDNLDSEHFATRQTASHQLDQLGSRAVGPARRSLATEQRLEVRHRLERFLRSRLQLPDTLRDHRAIFVLEQLEAKALLYRLAEGAPDAELTHAARAALQRLKDRDIQQELCK
jgi:WD40 repeat protein